MRPTLPVLIARALGASALTIALSGCVKVYQMPTPAEPHAVVKFRRTYEQSAGVSLRESLYIDEHVVFGETVPSGAAQTPLINGLLVRPEPATFTASSLFFHIEMRLVTETYYVQEPYTHMESYSCGTGTQYRTCMRTVTSWRSVPRTRLVTRPVEVPDGECSNAVRFLPNVGGNYLLQLTFQEHGVCALSCLEQSPKPNGEFQNKPCSAAPPAP